ncbi:MAG TPA: S41 family peptidase, partial [Gemmatimonadaceae bacterium]
AGAMVAIAPACAIARIGSIAPNAIAHPEIDSLTTSQIDNLVLLGKVWGFAKYHHPGITAGDVDWDADLLRIVPDVLRAPGRAAATTTISNWLARLDPPAACSPCARMPDDPNLRPNLDWIRDERTLGRALSTQLQRIYNNRRVQDAQRYVAFAPDVGNAVFTNEEDYAENGFPDAGLRLLALYRFWNIVEYWSPYRDLIGEDWDKVLREFVPRVWTSASPDTYRLSMMALIARLHDGHANLSSSLSVRPPRGLYGLPVKVRFVEGKAVVTGFSREPPADGDGLQVGDVISSIDGVRVDSLVTAWAAFYGASNQSARLRDMARALTQGQPGLARVTVERDRSSLNLRLPRVLLDSQDRTAGITHDLPGETFQQLTEDVAYLKLSSVSAAQADEYIQKAAGSKVLVIDIRNYPHAFMVFSLGGHFVSQPTEFARFTFSSAENPGAFTWTQPVSLSPAPPFYSGSVVILVDETSQSQAEYTAMAFRSAPHALVVGSTTAGADGNISQIVLPGGLRTVISGIGVFYPDRRPTQQVGIVPDLVVRPTIAGIRQGRDEVLEAAVGRALGRPFRLPRRLLP